MDPLIKVRILASEPLFFMRSRRPRFALLSVLLLASPIACHRSSPSSSESRASSADASSVTARSNADDPTPDTVEVLQGHPWIVELMEDVDGGPPRSVGFVTVPLGAIGPRPVVIALHGGGDRPEWACGEWRVIAGTYPFVVCPRGPGTDAFRSWSNVEDTKARTARAIEAARKRFRRWMAAGPYVLGGFSRGAIQAAEMAKADPKSYPRVALSESAFDVRPTMAFVRPWIQGGGERVLFGCTTVGCEAPFRNLAKSVADLGVPSRLNIAGTNQHGVWDTVIQSMQRDWPWLVEGMPAWKSFSTPPDVDTTTLPGRTVVFEPTHPR